MGGELQQDSFQLAFVVLWPVIQQFMTESKLWIFSWIKPESSARFKIAVSGCAAALSTAGFHWAGSWSAIAGGQFTLTIPPMVALAHMIGGWVGQHHVYTLMTIPKQNEVIIAQNRELIDVARQHLDVVRKGLELPAPSAETGALSEAGKRLLAPPREPRS